MTAIAAASRLQAFANEDPKGRHKLHQAGVALQASDPAHSAVCEALIHIANTHLSPPAALVDACKAHGLSDSDGEALISSLLTAAQGVAA